ncbi:hypothetical protein D3C84_1279290 [compost metagenome]
MALQGHREEEERVLLRVGLADQFLGQALVGGEDATLRHGRHGFFGSEGLEAERLID